MNELRIYYVTYCQKSPLLIHSGVQKNKNKKTFKRNDRNNKKKIKFGITGL